MLQSQEHSPSSPTCSPTHNLNKDKMKILQKSHGRFCEIWFATESSRHHPHFSLLAFKWAAQKHKMLWETSFFFQNRSRFTSILLSTLQFQVCTWQLSIPIQWLWNTTSRDSKANNTHATGHRRLKLSLHATGHRILKLKGLSLRVMFKGFIFSFPHASGLCCSLVIYQNGSLKSQRCYSYMNYIGRSSWSIQEVRRDAKIYYAHKCTAAPQRKKIVKLASVKPQKYML